MSGTRSGRSRVLTVPNLVSVIRILMVPLFWWVLLGGRPTAAALILVVMGVTDWLDGWLARRLDQATDLGALLDPIGDWLMMGSAVLGGMVETLMPVWVGAVILSRSVVVGLWSGWMTVRRRPLDVRMSGKAAITFLYVAIPLFYFSADLGGAFGAVIEATAWVAAVVGIVLYWWSGVLYLRDGLAVIGEKR
ncbi:MAG: CDP-alcohol phosphatidyltransferase family protein [Acidimicrobiia bacterium]|nr:CDP-alcohol phosphatidyltransferase family protein [bacterium]MXX01403.1 CDP-alcohol phosphatidyltransferase family protein [Acidimicrobiia bacterium]MXX44897.1 CDP-alcohol phosphatidyltransferase family protein [Acidimicrobiia bacterium]MXY74905.1 CDP-alcohol phosphatidyltransferase family protein [Acidimicrobiia bacterium]MYB78459.1 CDP-alcohol phosphatidyltransferase family protein [Acidimicrobiia bacterium]